MPKYRSFQYRLLQRSLVTNILLQKWNIIPDNKCSFCKNEIESVTHLLSECCEVRKLWMKFLEFVQQKYRIYDVCLSTKTIIVNEISKDNLVNFLCLVTKQFIYRQRCMGKSIEFSILKNVLYHVECVEKYIAIKNDKLNVHKKWKCQQTLDRYETVSGSQIIQEYIDDM